jgi:hypothetical protein
MDYYARPPDHDAIDRDRRNAENEQLKEKLRKSRLSAYLWKKAARKLFKALAAAQLRILEIQGRRCGMTWHPGALIPPGTPEWKTKKCRCVLERHGPEVKHKMGKP